MEVSGQWNLASPLLPLTINGTDRMLQVTHTHTNGFRVLNYFYFTPHTEHSVRAEKQSITSVYKGLCRHYRCSTDDILSFVIVSVQRCFRKDSPAVPRHIGKAACLHITTQVTVPSPILN